MKKGGNISTVQIAVDHRLIGKSSWLRVVREKTEALDETPESAQKSALQKT